MGQDSIAPLLEMGNPHRIPGRYIVRYKSSVDDPGRVSDSIVSAHGGRLYRLLPGLKAFWGELPDAAILALRRNPRVAYIEADAAIPVTGVGDTTQQGAPWFLDRIDQRGLPLDGTYQYSVVGGGVHIWIIDTGIDPNAPEIAGRVDPNVFVTNNGKDPFAPCHPHGTLMAVAAAGAVSGIAKQSILHSARVDEDCDGNISTGAASFAFEFIGDYSPRPAIINYSVTRDCWWIFCGGTVDDAAKYARDRGVTVVVSAGNGGSDLVGDDACGFSPAHVTELITVGATDASDQRHTFSNYGNCVDLFAPVNASGGTSTATAMVTGVGAWELQLYFGASPSAVASAISGRATFGVIGNVGSGSPNLLLYSRRLALTAAVSGPSTVGPFSSCTWDALSTGGQPTYAYEWQRNGTVVSTGPSYQVTQGGSQGFELSLKITDGVGRNAFAVLHVSVDPNNMELAC